jgi:hypothetical protein
MSITAIKWVFDHSETVGSARVLMLVIADMSNDDGECCPSKAQLADKVGVSSRQIVRLIQECERLGELGVIPQVDAEHGQTSNCYVLTKYLDSRK